MIWFQTPLHAAAANGEVDVVEILLRNGANINQNDVKIFSFEIMREYEGEQEQERGFVWVHTYVITIFHLWTNSSAQRKMCVFFLACFFERGSSFQFLPTILLSFKLNSNIALISDFSESTFCDYFPYGDGRVKGIVVDGSSNDEVKGVMWRKRGGKGESMWTAHPNWCNKYLTSQDVW
jgi:hypothetical protein